MVLQKLLPKTAVKSSYWGEIAVTADLGNFSDPSRACLLRLYIQAFDENWTLKDDFK
jgi:hypothetical protein